MLSKVRYKALAGMTVLMVALLSCMLVGCGSEEAPENEPAKEPVAQEDKAPAPEAEAENQEAMPEEDPDQGALTDANVVVEELDEDGIASLGAYDEFVDPMAEGEEYPLYLLFSTNMDASDFKFMDIEYRDSAPGDDKFAIVNVLYEQEVLTNGQPLLIETMFPGDMPSKGICFTQPTGEVVYFSMTHSGNDGSLILSPFTVAE